MQAGELCPTCGQKKKSTHSAIYASQWQQLPDRCKELVAWWISSPYFDKRLTKDEIAKYYADAAKTAIPARISELYRLDLVKRHEKSMPKFLKVTLGSIEGLPNFQKQYLGGVDLEV